MQSSSTKDELVIITTTPDATEELGRELARIVVPPALVGLSGPLGAGKTELVRGFASFYGASPDVSSPTFVLENVYPTRLNPEGSNVQEICHWDLYRVEQRFDLAEFKELARDSARVALIEWPERLPALDAMLDFRVRIEIEPSVRACGESPRRFVITGTGGVQRSALERLRSRKI